MSDGISNHGIRCPESYYEKRSVMSLCSERNSALTFRRAGVAKLGLGDCRLPTAAMTYAVLYGVESVDSYSSPAHPYDYSLCPEFLECPPIRHMDLPRSEATAW